MTALFERFGHSRLKPMDFRVYLDHAVDKCRESGIMSFFSNFARHPEEFPESDELEKMGLSASQFAALMRFDCLPGGVISPFAVESVLSQVNDIRVNSPDKPIKIILGAHGAIISNPLPSGYTLNSAPQVEAEMNCGLSEGKMVVTLKKSIEMVNKIRMALSGEGFQNVEIYPVLATMTNSLNEFGQWDVRFRVEGPVLPGEKFKEFSGFNIVNDSDLISLEEINKELEFAARDTAIAGVVCMDSRQGMGLSSAIQSQNVLDRMRKQTNRHMRIDWQGLEHSEGWVAAFTRDDWAMAALASTMMQDTEAVAKRKNGVWFASPASLGILRTTKSIFKNPDFLRSLEMLVSTIDTTGYGSHCLALPDRDRVRPFVRIEDEQRMVETGIGLQVITREGSGILEGIHPGRKLNSSPYPKPGEIIIPGTRRPIGPRVSI